MNRVKLKAWRLGALLCWWRGGCSEMKFVSISEHDGAQWVDCTCLICGKQTSAPLAMMTRKPATAAQAVDAIFDARDEGDDREEE